MNPVQTKSDPLPALVGMSHARMLELCRQAGAKDVHADNLRAAIYRHGNTDIDSIPELPAQLRQHILQHTSGFSPACTASQQSSDGTQKLLLSMADGKEVETVLIPGKGRITQCVSTQVGCAVGCTF